MTRRAATEGLTPDTVTALATEPVEATPAPKAPEQPPTGSAVATSQQAPQEQPTAPLMSARGYYAKARIELAEIERTISDLEDQRAEAGKVYGDNLKAMIDQRDRMMADFDVKLNDATLAWKMATEHCKVYETAAQAAQEHQT